MHDFVHDYTVTVTVTVTVTDYRASPLAAGS